MTVAGVIWTVKLALAIVAGYFGLKLVSFFLEIGLADRPKVGQGPSQDDKGRQI